MKYAPLMLLFVLQTNACSLSNEEYHTQAAAYLKTLTLEQKIGQLFMIGAALNPDDNIVSTAHPDRMPEEVIKHIAAQHIGGILFLHSGTKGAMQALMTTYNHRAAIPLLYAFDSEYGLATRCTDCKAYPKAPTLALHSLTEIEQIAYAIGLECKDAGIMLNLAPVVDIVTDEKSFLKDRSYGTNPVHVALCAKAYHEGLKRAGIAGCAKHFPGHGDTTVDSHNALPVITKIFGTLASHELIPFHALINQKNEYCEDGIDTIMIGHISVPALDSSGIPATLSHKIITNFLRETLGFQGVVITDALDMKGLTTYQPLEYRLKDNPILKDPYTPEEIALNALLAGCDILLCPQNIASVHNFLCKKAQIDETLYQCIEEHVFRIILLKLKLGVIQF